MSERSAAEKSEAKRCGRCGSAQPQAARFCHRCGHDHLDLRPAAGTRMASYVVRPGERVRSINLVEFPALVTTPPPPSTYPAIALADLDPADVPELAGWTVASRRDGHVALTRGDEVVDVLDTSAASAAQALDSLYERLGGDVADLSDSPTIRLGAPSNRFVSVAGSQFVAADAAQHGTTTISGAALAGGRPDGDAVVIAISRPGTSSVEEQSADGELLRAILAHL